MQILAAFSRTFRHNKSIICRLADHVYEIEGVAAHFNSHSFTSLLCYQSPIMCLPEAAKMILTCNTAFISPKYNWFSPQLCGSHHHTEFKSRILFYQVILTFVVCCPHGPITHEVLDQGLFKASGHGITVMDSPSVPAASRDASFLHRHCHELYGSNPVEPSSGAGCHGFESNPGSQCVPVVPRDLIWHWETWI